MSKVEKFLFWGERSASSILEHGEDAPVTMRIMGNVSELKKLIKLLEEAIQYAEADKSGTCYSEDDIDGQYVLIDAFVDGKRIKPAVPEYNPFEGWDS